MKYRLLGCAVIVAPLAACEADPFQRPGTWQLSGANDANLRAMVADPLHLNQGLDAGTAWGPMGAAPASRLVAGERQPLPAVGAAPIGARIPGIERR